MIVETFLPINHHSRCNTHTNKNAHIVFGAEEPIWLAKWGKVEWQFQQQTPASKELGQSTWGTIITFSGFAKLLQTSFMSMDLKEGTPLCFWGYCGGNDGRKPRKKARSWAAVGRERPRPCHNQSSCIPHSPASKACLSFGEKTEHIFRTQWNGSDWWVNTAGWAGDFVITKQIF